MEKGVAAAVAELVVLQRIEKPASLACIRAQIEDRITSQEQDHAAHIDRRPAHIDRRPTFVNEKAEHRVPHPAISPSVEKIRAPSLVAGFPVRPAEALPPHRERVAVGALVER